MSAIQCVSLALAKLGRNILSGHLNMHVSPILIQNYYNDYNLEDPLKRAGALKLVRYLQENGAP